MLDQRWGPDHCWALAGVPAGSQAARRMGAQTSLGGTIDRPHGRMVARTPSFEAPGRTMDRPSPLPVRASHKHWQSDLFDLSTS